MGREKKYTVKRLEEEIDKYFKSIAYTEEARKPPVWQNNRYVPGERIIDSEGKFIIVEKYIKPPSITALQNFLGISRNTWSKYAHMSEYSDVIERAKAKIEEEYWKMALEMGKDNKGVLFALENCFGYRKDAEREEMEAEEASKTITLAEKKQLLLHLLSDMEKDLKQDVNEWNG